MNDALKTENALLWGNSPVLAEVLALMDKAQPEPRLNPHVARWPCAMRLRGRMLAVRTFYTFLSDRHASEGRVNPRVAVVLDAVDVMGHQQTT